MDITISVPDITPLFINYIGVLMTGFVIGWILGYLQAIWPRGK